MPTLDPIVVNPPKEKKTYTFSDNDIKEISREVAQQEIAKIPTPASGTKLYKHKITLPQGKNFSFITNSATPWVKDDFKKDGSTFTNDVIIVCSTISGNVITFGQEYNGSYDSLTVRFNAMGNGTFTQTTVNVYDGFQSDTVTEL